MGLRTGGRRAKGLKNRVKSSKIELRFREIRSQSSSSRSAVQQAIIQPNIEKEQQTPKIQYFRGFFLCFGFIKNWCEKGSICMRRTQV